MGIGSAILRDPFPDRTRQPERQGLDCHVQPGLSRLGEG